MREPKIKPIKEIFKMSKKELIEYLKQSEISMRPTDSIKVIPFQHGTKILFYHKNKTKPYKTRVYLSKIEEIDLLR
ncbi:MAG: hypothetical protein HY295_05820 [Thaumarchaeota archaeon]|nr:hypothetical protein [Nitrososphaerota archaeon]